MGNKNREREFLTAVLEACPAQRGETRRILRRLSTAINVAANERPDFVFHIPAANKGELDVVVGLEHFMVDQNSEQQRSRVGVNSRGEKRRKAVKRLFDSLPPGSDMTESELSDAFLRTLSLAEEQVADTLSASYPELLETFRTSFLGHLHKVKDYRQTIQALSDNGERIEIGFLVEIHMDLSRYVKSDGKKLQECIPGELLLFEDMVEIMEKAQGKIDFIVLAYCGMSDRCPAQVLAIKCGNIRKGIMKQHVPVYVYAGSDADLDPFTKPRPTVNITNRESEEEGHFEAVMNVEGMRPDDETSDELTIRNVARVWEARRKGQPYITSQSVDMCVRAFGGSISGWQRLSSESDEWRIRPVWK